MDNSKKTFAPTGELNAYLAMNAAVQRQYLEGIWVNDYYCRHCLGSAHNVGGLIGRHECITCEQQDIGFRRYRRLEDNYIGVMHGSPQGVMYEFVNESYPGVSFRVSKVELDRKGIYLRDDGK